MHPTSLPPNLEFIIVGTVAGNKSADRQTYCAGLVRRIRAGQLILDGTGWPVSIRIGERSVESDGDNAYPRGFNQFYKAVIRLVGGGDFR